MAYMTSIEEQSSKLSGLKSKATVRKKLSSKKGGIGQSFDDYLKEDGAYEEVKRGSTKMTIAYRLEQIMKKEKITKVELAKRLSTSRSQLDRLLDPDNENVTLSSLISAARAVGCELILDLGSPEHSD